MSIHLNNRPAALNFKPMTIRSLRGTAARPARTVAKAMVAGGLAWAAAVMDVKATVGKPSAAREEISTIRP